VPIAHSAGRVGDELALADMRVSAKDCIRFRVPAASGALAELQIRVLPDRFGGWEARALLQAPDAAAPELLGRRFRASDRRLAVGKMIAWVRGHYRDAQPLSERAPPAHGC
jgi:hypothetical protein